MYSLDTNITLSVERSTERRRAVQSYGLQGGTESTPGLGDTEGDAAIQRREFRFGTALLIAIVFVGLVLAAHAWA
jgi:hypothetical protein